jgi:hypothetical protein
MDSNATRLLSDKFYEKRKQGALEIESTIRQALASNDHDRISKVVNQLCHDYAYSVHQPHARNGGLIGLAAAAIALGSVCTTTANESLIVRRSDICSRKSPPTSPPSSLLCWPASQTKMLGYDTMHVRACTTSRK